MYVFFFLNPDVCNAIEQNSLGLGTIQETQRTVVIVLISDPKSRELNCIHYTSFSKVLSLASFGTMKVDSCMINTALGKINIVVFNCKYILVVFDYIYSVFHENPEKLQDIITWVKTKKVH